jgi:hypothetical protein
MPIGGIIQKPEPDLSDSGTEAKEVKKKTMCEMLIVDFFRSSGTLLGQRRKTELAQRDAEGLVGEQ